MYNHNKAQQSTNRVHISWDILYLIIWCPSRLEYCFQVDCFLSSVLKQSQVISVADLRYIVSLDIVILCLHFVFLEFIYMALYGMFTIYVQTVVSILFIDKLCAEYVRLREHR